MRKKKTKRRKKFRGFKYPPKPLPRLTRAVNDDGLILFCDSSPFRLLVCYQYCLLVPFVVPIPRFRESSARIRSVNDILFRISVPRGVIQVVSESVRHMHSVK